MMSRAPLSIAIAALLTCVVLAIQKPAAPAQPKSEIPATALAMMPRPHFGDTLHMTSHVASFKMVPKGDELPSGRLEFSFKGTVLVTGLAKGSYLKTTGDVVQEYENVPHGKTVYFGNGKILIVGRFANVEWFGQNLDYSFTGSAVVRVIAEFDKNLSTGEFWFDPAEKMPLQNQLITLQVPQVRSTPMKAITRSDFERQKKKKGS